MQPSPSPVRQKLTMISVRTNGRQLTAFVQGTLQSDGKTVVPADVVQNALSKLACNQRGQTFSIG